MFTWTDERVDTLKSMWAQGLSAGQIAGRFGSVTRNAVIGKVHRLGLAGRATTVRKAHKPRRADHQSAHRRQQAIVEARVIAKPKRQRMPLFDVFPIADLSAPVPGAKLVTFDDLDRHHCRWMHGKLYCGCDQVPGLPYCAAHANVAFQPATPAGLPTVRRFAARRGLDRIKEAAL